MAKLRVSLKRALRTISIISVLTLTLALGPVISRATTVQIIGTVVDLTGAPLNGQACLQLPVNAVDTSLNRTISTAAVCFPVNNGAFPLFASVTPNDVMQPGNLYYHVRYRDSNGLPAGEANYSIPTAGGTFNIGLAVPTTITTTNISYISPALLNVSNVFTAPQTFPLNSITVNTLVAGGNSTCLETISSVVQWIACTSGTQVTVNGGAMTATANFGNLPAASANNLLGVWQQSGNNVSVQVPVSGNGAKAASVTGTLTSGHAIVIDANANLIDSGGVQPVIQKTNLGGTTCITGASSFSQCTSTLTWPSTWSSTAYRVTCSGIAPSDGRAALQGVTIKSTTQVTVEIVTNGSVAVSYGDVECVGVL